MTEVVYAREVGRKPDDEVTKLPKVPYATRLPEDVSAFLKSRDNQAEWITTVVREHPDYQTSVQRPKKRERLVEARKGRKG
jgi:hypothetical protein